MRGVPCGICSPHAEQFAETGILFSSYLICSSGSSGIVPTSMSLAFHYAATILGALGLFSKHVLHITGLPCVGLNGTVVSLPHSEQVTCVSIRRRPSPPCLLALHCLQCFGSLMNPFSRKNCLFTRREHKLQTATHTQDISVSKGHNPPSKLSRFREGSTRGQQSPL